MFLNDRKYEYSDVIMDVWNSPYDMLSQEIYMHCMSHNSLHVLADKMGYCTCS